MPPQVVDICCPIFGPHRQRPHELLFAGSIKWLARAPFGLHGLAALHRTDPPSRRPDRHDRERVVREGGSVR
ncbi:hypothetical protein, partial [Streptomyces viridochromogenes]|uniref:hypothetical protein n=1 Tax=Streptomyces viridochromogenes TaxID=1938 RepID=UPI00351E3D39